MSPVERKEVDIVSVDPLFIERQRNRYDRFASRAIAYVVWLNGLAAIALLISLAAHAGLPADAAHRFARGILVLAVGSVAGLASAFFGYIGRTLRLESPGLITWRTPWFAIIAAVIGVICFLAGVNMARHAVVLTASVPQAQTPAPSGETGNPEGQ